MSLFKLALTVAFMIAVCAPALAETIVDENLQASTPQNTSSVPENRSEDLKTPKTQPLNFTKFSIAVLAPVPPIKEPQ
jgi:hypothetical protein